MATRKRKKRKKTKTQKAHDKLKAALKRFDKDQGMVGRRNARKALSAALSAVRNAVDEEYPVIRKPPKRTGRLSPGIRRRRLRERGWVCVDAPIWGACAVGGLKPVKDPYTVDGEKKRAAEVSRRRKQKNYDASGLPSVPREHDRWVPGWAAHLARVVNSVALETNEKKRMWDRARKRGNGRKIVEAELYIRAAVNQNFIKPSIGRAAVKRVNENSEFRDAILAVGALTPRDVAYVIQAQIHFLVPELESFVTVDPETLGFVGTVRDAA
jgi:hypothetical protein